MGLFPPTTGHLHIWQTTEESSEYLVVTHKQYELRPWVEDDQMTAALPTVGRDYTKGSENGYSQYETHLQQILTNILLLSLVFEMCI